MDKIIPKTNKNARTIIAKCDGPKPTRQALPESIKEFVAIHMDKGKHIQQHTIKCNGGESPDAQVVLITEAFGRLMDISEWWAVDYHVTIQVRRAGFNEVAFLLGDHVTIQVFRSEGPRGAVSCASVSTGTSFSIPSPSDSNRFWREWFLRDDTEERIIERARREPQSDRSLEEARILGRTYAKKL
jgi:hypothetical protein